MAANFVQEFKLAFEVDTLLADLPLALQLFDRDLLRVLDAYFRTDVCMLACVSGVRTASLTCTLSESLFGWSVWLRI